MSEIVKQPKGRAGGMCLPFELNISMYGGKREGGSERSTYIIRTALSVPVCRLRDILQCLCFLQEAAMPFVS